MVNNPIRYNDPTGHMCSDPDDLWSARCDGSGATKSGDHIIPGEHVGGSQTPSVPSIPADPTTDEPPLTPEDTHNPPLYPDSLGNWKGWRNGHGFANRAPGIDALGIRIDMSGWIIGGIDVNVDIIYFRRSKQVGIFLTPGFQVGPGGGQGVTGGLLFGKNMPTRDAYAGPSLVIGGGDIPIVPLGMSFEGDISVNLLNDDGSVPITTYVGIGPLQPEVGAYSGGGYAIDLFGIFQRMLK